MGRSRSIGAITMLAIALAASCSSTKTSVTQVWQAPLPVPQAMRNVIVFGVRTDEATRRTLEDRFAAELAKHGLRAVPSYQVFTGALPDQEKARQRVKELGFEGALVADLKDVRERQTFVPGSYSGGFWTGYYGTGWGYGSPGYVVTDEIVTFETTLWDLRQEDKLVWAALTKTTNPASGPKFVKSLTNAVLPKLQSSGQIPPEPER